jgi:hypothetical protein
VFAAACAYAASSYKTLCEARKRGSHQGLIIQLSLTPSPSFKMLAKSFTLSLAYAALATAQSASPTFSVAPAAETLATAVTPANVVLFDFEAVQLTDDVISTLQENPDLAEYALLFEFEDSSNSTLSARTRRARRSLRCKTMPGDLLYPNQTAWNVFDLLLGGALEKIVPIGSPCYKKSEYNNYDAAKCAILVKNFDAEEI